MKVCVGSDETAPKLGELSPRIRSFDGEPLPKWPTLMTTMLGSAVQATTLSIFVRFAGVSVAGAAAPVPPSNTKLKRLLAEVMLENAALKDHQPVPPPWPAISDDAAMQPAFRRDTMSLRIEQ